MQRALDTMRSHGYTIMEFLGRGGFGVVFACATGFQFSHLMFPLQTLLAQCQVGTVCMCDTCMHTYQPVFTAGTYQINRCLKSG